MELYVSHNLADEPPDGGFEIGLVSGFLTGFAGKGGFTHTPPIFDDALIGAARVKRGRADLSRSATTLRLYAYIFVRQPSLTFVTLRPPPDATTSIEAYLARVRPK